MIIFKAKLISIVKQTRRMKISFGTSYDIDELVLLQLKGISGWVAFNEDQFKESVEKAMADRKIAIDSSGKSHSQKLRGELMAIWNTANMEAQRNSLPYITFDEYYDKEMTKIINHYHSKYNR